MIAKVRTAIIGAGFSGRQHIAALRRLGTVDVVAVVVATDEHAREVQRDLGIEWASSDYRRVVIDAGVDVVHVCTPNNLHVEMAALALASGKHVVCEKPLASDLDSATDLAQRASSADLVAVLCHNYRFFPMVAEFRERIAAQALGHLHKVRGQYLQDWLLSERDTKSSIDAEQAGGSSAIAIADIGTHWVDLAETITGRRLEAVMADIPTLHARPTPRTSGATFERRLPVGEWRQADAEDEASMLLRFDDGLTGVLTISQVAAGHKNDLAISVDGTLASFTWQQERPDELLIGHCDETNEVLLRGTGACGPTAQRLGACPLVTTKAGRTGSATSSIARIE